MGLFDGDDGERFKNFVLFRFYGTDKEVEENGGFILGLTVVVIVVFFLVILLF